MPPGFPQSSLPIQRALCAISIACPDKLEDCIAALYQASFAERIDVFNKERLVEVLGRVLGERGAKEVLEKSDHPDAKALLQKNMDRALGEGSFGLPWYTVTNSEGRTKHFWGFDHLGQVCGFLGLETPRASGKLSDEEEGAEKLVSGWRAML